MEVEKLKKCLRQVVAVYPQIQRILLFGSFARGTESRRSDIDLILVMETNKPFFQRYEGIHEELLEALKPFPLEFFIYTPQEFDRMVSEGSPFITRALREGKMLYEH